ncbi:pyruvate phosphate dikinase, partial [candidate division KSB3 bacterium]|nr:pyruvate phosphate dikinase [candidate division KSB3 bacterium]MBD3325953.1 pyruvate phosphate dikinase [candidate division KSB3 bacterium]
MTSLQREACDADALNNHSNHPERCERINTRRATMTTITNDPVTFSSGIPSLDDTLQGIWAGDNIVFQVDDLQDFLPFVHRFCHYAAEAGIPLVYFRFADHPSFLPEGVSAECYYLDPQQGFENFISEIFEVIEKYGKRVYYLFDCLSGLAVDWYTDRMLANFFMLTCPYLYTYDTVTYFVLLRNSHRPLAIQPIHNTAQVVLDVFRSKDTLYVLPLKVLKRHSPTMYMLHSWEEGAFHPVTKSVILSEILSNTTQFSIDFNTDRKDIWTTTFMRAQTIDQESEHFSPEEHAELKTQLIKMIISRDKHIIRLCERYFSLSDLVSIGKRMIGSGLIGGKSAGMLLARGILRRSDEKFQTLLERHDSFFIGSDVFYTYVIQNDCWWERHYLKKSAHLFEDAKLLQKKLLTGEFPSDILEQFQEMLNYFGQSPIIVRSSSLLEDAYGNAFSGKYESVFCANQGTPMERLTSFIEAVRRVY